MLVDPDDTRNAESPAGRAFVDGARRIRTADLLGAIRVGHDRGRREKGPMISMFAGLAMTPAVHGCAGISGD